MPIVETPVLTLGPAVTKAILKSWLQSDVTSSAGASLIDFLSSRTGDVLAQQRGRRQFEAIGEQVAESLQPLFEAAPLDEAGRTAVALAVADMLEQTGAPGQGPPRNGLHTPICHRAAADESSACPAGNVVPANSRIGRRFVPSTTRWDAARWLVFLTKNCSTVS